MPGYYYSNPYTAETPIGAGLQNIASALFRGKQMGEGEDKSDLNRAHAALYRSRAGKEESDRKLNERLLQQRSPTAENEVIGAASGVPTFNVAEIRRGLNRYGGPGVDFQEQTPGVQRAMTAVLPTYADKTIDAERLAKALDSLRTQGVREDVMAGRRQAPIVGQAYAATEAKPLFHFNEGSAGNLFTGAQTMNPLGDARGAQARATAERETQHARVFQGQADSGVDYGAPVLTEGEGGVPTWTSRRDARNKKAAFDPTKGRAGGGSAADTTTTTPIVPLKISKQDNDLMLGAIDRSIGGRLGDPMMEGAILSRAQEYFKTPGSPTFGKHEESARRASADVSPKGFESKYWGGIGSMKPSGETVTNFAGAPIQLTGPTTNEKTVERHPVAPRPGARPAAPAAPAPVAARGGKTDQQLITEANAAIQSGAPREAVMARMKALGVNFQ